LLVDESGPYLNIPEEIWQRSESEAFRMLDEFEKWVESACEHKDMRLADEWLSNISGMGAFRSVVRHFGGENRFPVLTRFLPSSNDGSLPALYAVEALAELKELGSEKTAEERILLSEQSSATVIASVRSDTYYCFAFDGTSKISYAIDKEGFFILKEVEEDGKQVYYVLFRSMKFTQQSLSQHNFRFTDLSTGDAFESKLKLHPAEGVVLPRYEFEIVTKRVPVGEEYSYMIQPLIRLMEASVLSDNDVMWC
jgi:hypothetical protein